MLSICLSADSKVIDLMIYKINSSVIKSNKTNEWIEENNGYNGRALL